METIFGASRLENKNCQRFWKFNCKQFETLSFWLKVKQTTSQASNVISRPLDLMMAIQLLAHGLLDERVGWCNRCGTGPLSLVRKRAHGLAPKVFVGGPVVKVLWHHVPDHCACLWFSMVLNFLPHSAVSCSWNHCGTRPFVMALVAASV